MSQEDLSRLLLQLNRDKKEHSYIFENREYIIEEGVFSPAFFNAHIMCTNALAASIQTQSFLEIGAGCGITGIHLLLKGCIKSLDLSDINPAAVKNCQRNATLFDINDKVTVFESDIFNSIPPHNRYDAIYWNYPWMYKDQNYVYADNLERGLFDPGYRLLERYIAEANQHLTLDGNTYLGFGSSGNLEKLMNICSSYNKTLIKIHSEESTEINPIIFDLYEIIDSRILV